MSALAGIEYDVTLRDSRHPHAAAAREQADWLSWLELGGASPTTLFTYQWTTDHLLAAFPSKAFLEFTDGDLAFILRGFPQKSRKARKYALQSWFKWGYRTRRIDQNPMELLPTIKTNPQPVITVFTDTEIKALEGLPEPDGTLMGILLEAGLRKAEARHLTGKRVRFETLELLVIEGAKGGKQRELPLEPWLSPRLAAMFLLEAIGPNDHLWATYPGGGRARRSRPISETAFHKWWGRCLDDAGVEYRKPHTARHTFATRWRRRGLELDDVQKLLGHSSIATTESIYDHKTMSDIARRQAAIRERED